MADPKKPSASDFFDGDVDLAEFARGMARLPELGTMMRLAGLGDAQRLSAVKMTSSRLDAVRARTVGTDLARTRAARAGAHVTQLATKLKQEEETAKPEVGILDQLAPLAGRFQIYGKVLDAKGRPVPMATVEVSGKDTGVMFTAKTDKDGVYRLGLPVGEKDTEANDGEQLFENVMLDGTVLQSGLVGVAKAGEMARRVLSVPLAQTIATLAAPILRGRTGKSKAETPASTPEKPASTPQKSTAKATPAKPETPKPTVPKPTGKIKTDEIRTPAPAKPKAAAPAKTVTPRTAATPAKAPAPARAAKPAKAPAKKPTKPVATKPTSTTPKKRAARRKQTPK